MLPSLAAAQGIDEALQKRKLLMCVTAKPWPGQGYPLPVGCSEKVANYAYFPILVQPDYP